MAKRVFPQLDGLRGLAALIVLIHHYWPGSMRWETSGGRIGVDIFFVLSGFLITRSLLRARAEHPGDSWTVYKKFHRRRVFRIMPAYYVTLALIFFIPSDRNLSLLWHAAFLSNIYFVLQGHYVGSTSHLWALAVEQHFYLLWPLAVLFVPRRHLAKMAFAMIAAGLAFRVIAGLRGWSSLAIDVMTPFAGETLGAGALLACAMETRTEQSDRWGGWIRQTAGGRLSCGVSMVGILGAAFAFIRIFSVGTPAQFWCFHLLTELSRALILTWIVGQAVWGIPGLVGRALSSLPARAIGWWSYSIYLSHNFFMAFAKSRLFHFGSLSVHNSQALLAAAATFAWSIACYEFLEKPLQQ